MYLPHFNLSCLTHSEGGGSEGLWEPGLYHGFWGGSYQTEVIVTCLWSPAPHLALPRKHLLQSISGGCSGRCKKGWLPQVGCSLSHLPVLLLCACCWSPKGCVCVGGGGIITLMSSKGIVPRMGPLLGGFAGSCLWAPSVQAPCFKGSGA